MKKHPKRHERTLIEPSYSRYPKVGNPIASILKSNVQGVPALFGLNPVSNFMEFTVNPFVGLIEPLYNPCENC